MTSKKLNIYLRRDGRWEGRLAIGTHHGKTSYRYVYAKSKEEAESKLLALMDGTRSCTDAHPAAHTSFEAVVAAWMAASRARLKPSSIAQYQTLLERYLLPTFGEKDITTIKRGDISSFLAELMMGGGACRRALSDATALGIISAAKNIFMFAAREMEIPVADISHIAVKRSNTCPRVLSAHEQKRLEEALNADLSPGNLGILLCLYTGLRIGEICALRWREVSKIDQSISVICTMQRIRKHEKGGTEVVLMEPKSQLSSRIIPVPGHIGKLLIQYRQKDAAWLLTADTKRFMEPRCLQYRFKALLASCGMRDINFHALRHTFATRCNDLGFDVKTLSEIMGHSGISMTLGRYVHPSFSQKQKNMELLHPLASGLCG